ncbi:hypothetical protein JNW91_18125 [Micromonospora sp. STR1_7]|uniref:PepSY domain-containing protein n=1 Tax=Micromonospora parastrephiae TaxID=2806101 RepID=A0ABS1XWG4_9ACTN|nr:hypothetical protein [Micromonospora parastrephiae]MBM0233605.1 hypothetical protein [Micromonospora parastrephiae]
MQKRAAAAMVAAVVAMWTLGWTLGSSAGAEDPGAAPAVQRITDPPEVPVPATGSGRDPLTPAETTRARELALAGLTVAGAGGPIDVTGAAGPELLTVRRADGDGIARRAEVLAYDYRADKLVKVAVDLTAGRVTGTFAATGMQPPATPREVATAVDLLWRHDLGDLMRERFRQATGVAPATAAELQPGAQTYTGEPCAVHRCVLLLLHRPGEPYVDLTDLVVDLSAGTVVRLP